MSSSLLKIGLMLSLTQTIGLTLMLLTLTLCSAQQCTTPGCSHCTSATFRCSGLATLPPSNQIQQTVEEISLTGGTIPEIPAAYVSFPDLSSLNLSSNFLTSLDVNSFENVKYLATIDLTGNNIACDPNIDWLKLWLGTHPTNEVLGDCTSGNSISQYLGNSQGFRICTFMFLCAAVIMLYDLECCCWADKPGPSDVSFEGDVLEYGRSCQDPITIPVTISPPLTVDITYVTSLVSLGSASDADITVVADEVIVQAQGTSLDVTLNINNGGREGEVKEYLLDVAPKSPISFSRDTRIVLVDGNACELRRSTPAPTGQTPLAPTGQTPPAPTGQTPPAPMGQTPPATMGQTPREPTDDILTTKPPEQRGTSGVTECGDKICPRLSCPEDLQRTYTCCPECPQDWGLDPCELSGTCPSTSLTVVYIIIPGLGIMAVIGVVGGYYMYKKHKKDKSVAAATADSMKVTYSPVGPEAKVYNATTEDL